jgi:hypothetical protein
MPHVIEKTVFSFAELEGRAKERALEWLREDPSDFYAESVLEDFATVCDLIGVSLDTRGVKLMNGSTRQEPKVYWSGFWSQGDGACFEGDYRYIKGAARAIREHAPEDAELHRIADALERAQRPYFYQLTATCSQRGHYMHSGCMSVDVEHAEDQYRDVSDAEDDIRDALRSLADWLYCQLEREHDYQTSEEVLAETAEANGYEFDEDGRIV